MALPTVTAKDLHVVQLDPKLRKILHHRAAAAERRAYAPVLAADRGAFGEANRAYQLEKGSVKGASHLLEGALGQALAGLKGSGLTGGYLKRAQNELIARQGDSAQAIPFLLADAGTERTKALLAARQQLTTDRAQMLQGSAQGFNSLLKESRTAGAAQLKEDAGHEVSDEKAQHKERQAATKEVDLAVRAAHNLLTAYPEELPSTKSEWAIFAEHVAKADGVGLRAALDATQQIRQQQEEERERRLAPPGLEGPAGGPGERPRAGG